MTIKILICLFFNFILTSGNLLTGLGAHFSQGRSSRLVPPLHKPDMVLGVLDHIVNDKIQKVLFDYEDHSGNRVKELYQGAPYAEKPTRITFKLEGDDTMYTGITWTSGLPCYKTHFFLGSYSPGAFEVKVALPAPDRVDLNRINFNYNASTGSEQARLEITETNDLKFMWVFAEIKDLKIL